MKKLLFVSLCFFASVALGQTTYQIDTAKKTIVTSTRMVMTGAEAKKIFDAMKFAPGIYDQYQQRIDSAEAMKSVKTYDYGITLKTMPQGLTYRILTPLNTPAQAQRDEYIRKSMMLKNPTLQEGAVLDLRPFGNEIPADKVAGKAIVLVFWYPGGFGGSAADAYKEINEITSQFVDKGKFEMYAVTKYPRNQAIAALNKVPILNAHHIFDAANLIDIYAPENKIVTIITDKDHKITYSAWSNVGITPRVLYKSLKAL